ncbi:MAG: hypothetical protein R2699_12545 [Acidimicrobiales bacterium]
MRITVAVIGEGRGAPRSPTWPPATSGRWWASRSGVADEITTEHRNSRYLAGYDLHPSLRATADLAEAVRQADVVVMGVPSHCFRATLTDVAEHIRAWVPVVSLTKGLEQGTRLRMTQVIQEVLLGIPTGC